MSNFGTALKRARKAARKKLREVSEHVGLSIGYLSDIEQGRKAPPDLDVVEELEKFLLVSDSSLVKIADEDRTKRPSQVAQQIQERPELSELFFRVKDLPEKELEKLIEQLSKK